VGRRRLQKFENALPVKSRIADSGSKVQKQSRFTMPRIFQPISFRKRARYVKSKTTWPYARSEYCHVLFSQLAWVGVQRAETVMRMCYIINNSYAQCKIALTEIRQYGA